MIAYLLSSVMFWIISYSLLSSFTSLSTVMLSLLSVVTAAIALYLLHLGTERWVNFLIGSRDEC